MAASITGSSSQIVNRKRITEFGIYNQTSGNQKRRKPIGISYASECDNPGNIKDELNESLWKPNAEYNASGLKNNLHGDVYQLKHLMLILQRARERKLSFQLATEINSAESFDDLVFMYTLRPEKVDEANVTNNNVDTDETNTENEMNTEHRFVQIKHKQDDLDDNRLKEISLGQLLSDDGAFSLKQYFRSWRKIHEHTDFRKSGKSKKHFLLCTNIGLSSELLREEGPPSIRAKELEDRDEFLEIGNRHGKRFKLVVEGKAKDELYNKLKLVSDRQQLAEKLANCVNDKTKDTISLDLRVSIFNKYKNALKHNVIDTRSKKFSTDFIERENLSPKIKEFRQLLLTKVGLLNGETEEATKNRLKNMRINVTVKSDEPALELPDDDVKDDEITEFLEAFTLVVDQPNEVNLGGLIYKKIGEHNNFDLLNNNFIGDSFLKNILNWFKAKRGFYLDEKITQYFFDKAERELSSLITVGLNLAYLAEFDEPYKFTASETVKLKNFLGNTNDTSNRILALISSEHTVTTATRVYQIVRDMDDFKKNDSFIFMQLKKLLSPKINEHVLRAFQSDRSHNLLVIDCGSNSALKDRKELLELLSSIQNVKKSRKRLILITYRSDRTVLGASQIPRKIFITRPKGDIFDWISDIDKIESFSDIEKFNGV